MSKRRTTVSLGEDTFQLLIELSELRGSSLSSTVRLAIQILGLMSDEIQEVQNEIERM